MRAKFIHAQYKKQSLIVYMMHPPFSFKTKHRKEIEESLFVGFEDRLCVYPSLVLVESLAERRIDLLNSLESFLIQLFHKS